MSVPGVSTIGVKFGYALESVAGTKPSAFTQLTRVNTVGGIDLSVEQIDASALEDAITRYIAGRADTGGTWPVTINPTNDTISEWETVISTYKNRASTDLQMWWEVWSPFLDKAFYIIAEPPSAIPMSEMSQNSLQTIEMSLTINEYKGMDTAIEPS